ncbi:MAG: hypothetical protein MUC59_02110 [Saprospiraceae bacterium]|jgi:hypothetical protein|nr:hypothetical protein [Saprospiraceae bacterium]
MMLKARVFSLVVSFLMALSAFSQDDVPQFTVQVGNYANPKPSDFAQLQSHGFLYATKRPNHTDVYMGGYANENEAGEALATLQLFGFGNAAITKLNTEGGQPVSVIQLATKRFGDKINWEEYLTAGQLYVLLSGKQVKIFAGTFPDVATAKAQLAKLQKTGFKDAFVKNVNNVLLHEVGDFEMGGAPKRPLIPLVFEEKKEDKAPDQPKEITTPATTKQDAPKAYEEVVAIVQPAKVVEKPAKAVEMTPKGSETKAEPQKAEPVKKEPVKVAEPEKTVAKEAAPAATPVNFEASLPDIRPNVKRTSAYELQKALKAEGSYKGSLDGFYGKGTRTAYDLALANNRQLEKYRILAKYQALPELDANKGSVQYHINNLWDDPKSAIDGLADSKAPIARAYRAYHRYVTEGQSKDVNWLMNEAIKEAFAGKKTAFPQFDPTQRYAYEDIDQLLTHLRYIHEVSADSPAAPCWLFRKHPSAALKAFGPQGTDSKLKLQACGGFWEWEEVKVLDAIARDLNGLGQTSEAAVAKSQSQLAQLYLTPKALNDEERKALEAWNAKLWQGIEGWSSRDPMLSEIATALKISYLQAEVLFEDFFMDAGFNEREAKALGLQAMKVMVGHHLERFI